MKVLLTILAVVSFSLSAQAEEKKYKAPWGMAGCGLWAGIIKGKDQGSQLGVYALRNLVLNSQTSAMTSGTSGCVEKSAYTAQVEQEVFVDINLASLQVEAAQGSGPVLNALAEVFGCADKQGFNSLSKGKYQDIYQSQDPKQIINNYQHEIKASELANQCARLG